MTFVLPVGLSKVNTSGGLQFLHAEKSQSGSTELFHMMGGLHILVDGKKWVKFTKKAIVKQYQAKIDRFDMAEAQAWKDTQNIMFKAKRDEETIEAAKVKEAAKLQKVEAAKIKEAAKLQKVKDKQEKKKAMKLKGSKTKKAMKAKSS
jgi:hypothetical protein